MKQSAPVKGKTRRISLDLDMNAVLTGFGAAKSPTHAHRRVMNNFASALLLGPPPGDALLEMITHMFTDEEADVAQHLAPLLPLTAGQIAFLCGRSVNSVQPILDNMANNKRVILYFGKPTMYTIVPLVPGLFEMVVVTPDLSRTNHWHKRFSELFEKVWDTKFILDYIGAAPPQARYLPTQANAAITQSAWPSDRIEELLEPYDVFGITHCQCRLVTELAGKGCGKPTENCSAMGPEAQTMIDRGFMRRADKQEIIEAKRIAEENGCVSWMLNGKKPGAGNISCSCCGCCCHAMRTITQFNTPGYISKPHFMPRLLAESCNSCGACATACPMGAWKNVGGAMRHDAPRCIGCGLCVTACKRNAMELRALPDAKKPEEDDKVFVFKMIPAYVETVFKVWVRRTAGI